MRPAPPNIEICMYMPANDTYTPYRYTCILTCTNIYIPPQKDQVLNKNAFQLGLVQLKIPKPLRFPARNQ